MASLKSGVKQSPGSVFFNSYLWRSAFSLKYIRELVFLYITLKYSGSDFELEFLKMPFRWHLGLQRSADSQTDIQIALNIPGAVRAALS